MHFPIVIIKPKEASLYFFEEKNFGLVSKGGESFYKYGTVIDSNGQMFDIKGVKDKQKAPFMLSLKCFQPMYLVAVNTDSKNTISLADFKKLIIEHIAKYKPYWEKKDLIEELIKSIEQMRSFEEVIRFSC